jgi:hypothetical protein
MKNVLAFLRRYGLWLALAAIAAAHIVIFIKLFESGFYDVELYFGYASKIMSGLMPYRDFAVEYPPGALLVFLLPRLFAPELTAFGTAFAAEMLMFDLACLVMVLLLARRLRLSPLPAMIIYTLAVAAVSSIAVQRFDFASAALSLAAVFAFGRGNYKTAWALVAVGTLVKLYPAVLAPLFFIYQWRHQRWQRLVAPALVFGAVMLAGMLPFYLLSPDGFIHAFSLQSGRNLQIESSYASVLFMIYALGRTALSVFQGPVSWDMDSPYSTVIANVSLAVMFFAAAAVIVTYLLPYGRKQPENNGPPPPAALGRLINFSLLLITVILLTSKVVSTQFMIWLLPFIALVSGRARYAVWPAFVAAGFFTWYTYPVHYWDLRNLNLSPMQVIFFRNVLLALIAFWLWEAKEPEVRGEELNPKSEARNPFDFAQDKPKQIPMTETGTNTE